MFIPTIAAVRQKTEFVWPCIQKPSLTWQGSSAESYRNIFISSETQFKASAVFRTAVQCKKGKGLYKMKGKGRVSENKAEWDNSEVYKEMQA